MGWAYAYMAQLHRPPGEFLRMKPGEQLLTIAYLSKLGDMQAGKDWEELDG